VIAKATNLVAAMPRFAHKAAMTARLLPCPPCSSPLPLALLPLALLPPVSPLSLLALLALLRPAAGAPPAAISPSPPGVASGITSLIDQQHRDVISHRVGQAAIRPSAYQFAGSFVGP
jgi:hypothetical protein